MHHTEHYGITFHRHCGEWGLGGATGNQDIEQQSLQLPEVRLPHRLLSSSFLGVPYRILNMNHKIELPRSLWVRASASKVQRLVRVFGAQGS